MHSMHIMRSKNYSVFYWLYSKPCETNANWSGAKATQQNYNFYLKTEFIQTIAKHS